MPFGERLKELRKERNWSQAELAEKVGSDARQISRYEHGRIVPSVEVAIRIAEVFDVSLDFLLVPGTPRRRLHAPENGLGDHLAGIDELPLEDRRALLNVLDAFVTKSKLRALTGGLG